MLLISKIPHFESNSQLTLSSILLPYGCYWYQRYLILKAIHNGSSSLTFRQRVVTDIKDTSFWKQFTTATINVVRVKRLLLISKIPHFESNSQRGTLKKYLDRSCYWYQRYLILKAIHNGIDFLFLIIGVVTDIKDTSFWKQFTTLIRFSWNIPLLLLISKIPHFESNSQLFLSDWIRYKCCYWYQRYLILKAIHNKDGATTGITGVVTDIKDTSFWKQFTTCLVAPLVDGWLLLISKIPHFESNSQRPLLGSWHCVSCYWYQRYLILKAIHNLIISIFIKKKVVTDIKDTSFWKQFTTS